MSAVTLTSRDQELLYLAFTSFTTQPKVDYKDFAQKAGLTEGSAKKTWSVLKKKVLGGGNSVAESAFKVTKPRTNGKGPKKGAKGHKVKKGGKGNGEDEDEEEEEEVKEEVKSEEDDEDDEVEEVPQARKVKVEVIDD